MELEFAVYPAPSLRSSHQIRKDKKIDYEIINIPVYQKVYEKDKINNISRTQST